MDVFSGSVQRDHVNITDRHQHTASPLRLSQSRCPPFSLLSPGFYLNSVHTEQSLRLLLSVHFFPDELYALFKCSACFFCCCCSCKMSILVVLQLVYMFAWPFRGEKNLQTTLCQIHIGSLLINVPLLCRNSAAYKDDGAEREQPIA